MPECLWIPLPCSILSSAGITSFDLFKFSYSSSGAGEPMDHSLRSLPVTNVQALAVSCAATGDVPQRYVRPEIDAHAVVSEDTIHIPVIDLARLVDPKSHQDESYKLHLACEDWGFFQVFVINPKRMNGIRQATSHIH